MSKLKRTKDAYLSRSIGATETGKIPGDYSGSRNFQNIGDASRLAALNSGIHSGGPAPIPDARAPHASSQNILAPAPSPAPTAQLGRVKQAPNGPFMGLNVEDGPPHPANTPALATRQPLAPNPAPAASQKPKKARHPFFGSNEYGY